MNKIKIKLIVGLGNPARLNSRSDRPGKTYENTRHNTGFLFVDELAQLCEVLDKFRYNKKLYAELVEGGFPEGRKILFAKPQIFINNSGQAVLVLSKFFRIKPENILVIHDDIDILWSKFKFSFGRSSAGHKGVESIIKALKTKNFWRLRVGIQPIRQAQGKPTIKKRISADKIILKKFTSAELKTLNQTIKNAISELEQLLSSRK